MFRKKKEEVRETSTNSIPAYLDNEYPYKAVGKAITNYDTIKENDIYEISCSICNLCIRTQGAKMRNLYARVSNSGCISCGNKDLLIKIVDMNSASKQ